MPSPVLRRVLIALELFLAVGAFSGSLSFLNDPSGVGMGMPAEEYLAGTPFGNYLAPAVILFALNGVFPLLTIVAAVMRMPWAKYAHLGVGLLLTGWMLGQGLLIGLRAPIQFLMLGLGLVILAVAVVAWNQARPGHHGPLHA